jgi:methionine biosynthesis protein MetW
MALEGLMRSSKHIYETYWKDRQSKTKIDKNDGRSQSEIIETVVTVLKKGEKFLDVGCGNGALMEITEDKFDKIHGCDISETALYQAKERGMMGTCVDLNAEALPYRDASFDCVTCLEVVEHVMDPLHLLKDIYRVLRPKGSLVLTTPNIRYVRNLSRLVMSGKFPHTTTDTFVWGGGHLHYFTRKDMAYLLKQAGFKQCKFLINMEQFGRSWKRRLIVKLMGKEKFGEWVCGGIAVEAFKG